jgi:AraC family transcriptional regulator, regulatory protein of adaptative response / methylated-DNA-[protein]-cysteine methyltransferase
MNKSAQSVNPKAASTSPLHAAETIDPDRAWDQIVRRDRSANFFYAVTTTGVVCRPACKSRLPLRTNVRFFASVALARAEGFRSCLRCRPEAPPDRSLEQMRAYLESHVDEPVRLSELGRLTGLSPFSVQRLFKSAMGVSPLQYQRALRAARLRSALKQGETVTDAIYTAGFESSSRGYEGAQLGMTPARFAAGGKGEHIRWAASPSPFGWMAVGETDKGLCWLSLAASQADAESALREEFPAAELRHDPSLSGHVDTALASVRDGSDLVRSQAAEERLDLRGTVFQLRVWQALRTIPRGQTRSYGQLARELGDPNATRAVARACATNRVALLVPCHRVVGAGGSLTGYRWGVDRKRRLLEEEARSISKA